MSERKPYKCGRCGEEFSSGIMGLWHLCPGDWLGKEYGGLTRAMGKYRSGIKLPETPTACAEAEKDTPTAEIEADNAAFLRSFGVRNV